MSESMTELQWLRVRLESAPGDAYATYGILVELLDYLIEREMAGKQNG